MSGGAWRDPESLAGECVHKQRVLATVELWKNRRVVKVLEYSGVGQKWEYEGGTTCPRRMVVAWQPLPKPLYS